MDGIAKPQGHRGRGRYGPDSIVTSDGLLWTDILDLCQLGIVLTVTDPKLTAEQRESHLQIMARTEAYTHLRYDKECDHGAKSCPFARRP